MPIALPSQDLAVPILAVIWMLTMLSQRVYMIAVFTPGTHIRARLQVIMYDCFRPGDIVRAEVLSLGDVRSYFLTTAKNELGVVFARSIAGVVRARQEQVTHGAGSGLCADA